MNTCETCNAYVPNAPKSRDGTCRAHSPTAMFLGMMQVPGLQNRQQAIVQGFWPPVRSDLVACREWQPKPEDMAASFGAFGCPVGGQQPS